MSWRAARSVRAALAEASRRYPGRNRVHDGTVGDLAHSARASDHNPDERGVVLAFDLTHDPARGCDAHALVRAAVDRRDPRIKYAISQGRIWSAAKADQGWRRYTGANRHDKHAHVSVARAHEDDTSAWWPAAPTRPLPEPKPAFKEAPDMIVVAAAGKPTCLLSNGRLWPLDSNAHVAAYTAAGVPLQNVTPDQFSVLDDASKKLAKMGAR